jgi:hypothetical protein
LKTNFKRKTLQDNLGASLSEVQSFIQESESEESSFRSKLFQDIKLILSERCYQIEALYRIYDLFHLTEINLKTSLSGDLSLKDISMAKFKLIYYIGFIKEDKFDLSEQMETYISQRQDSKRIGEMLNR